MIGYLEGIILKKETERILVLANQIGYEVLLPVIVSEGLKTKQVGDEVSLFIFHQQTERQPKPLLIGFNLEEEKDFFQQFISVEDIGPMKAVKALTLPVSDIADAIESKDTVRLAQLKGIGKRTAQKIIASLQGKVEKFAFNAKPAVTTSEPVQKFTSEVMDILVGRLGYRQPEAKQLIADAMDRNPDILTAENLLDEIYHSR